MVGHQAGWDNNRTNGKSDANNNTMIGSMAGSTNRTGSNHLIVGANADIDDDEKDNGTGIGGGIQFGEDNVTVLGYGATVDGNYGLAIGNYVEVDYIGGIGIGYETDISKNYSIGIGHQTTITYIHSIGIGYQTNISEEYSIGIGNSSTVSGAYSIALGSGSSNTTYNAAAIGYGTTVGGNHEIAFGNASTTTIGGTVDFTSLSDGRFKTNIQENVIGLDFIRELRPVTYQLTANGLNAIRQTGFIAQEVEQASNKLNFSFSGIDYRKNQDLYGLRYAEFVVPLVKAIQELQPKIENQQVVLENQQAQFNQYHQQLLELAAELEQLENN